MHQGTACEKGQGELCIKRPHVRRGRGSCASRDRMLEGAGGVVHQGTTGEKGHGELCIKGPQVRRRQGSLFYIPSAYIPSAHLKCS